MTTRLRVVAEGWADLTAHLFRGDGREHAAFLPTRFVQRGGDVEALALRPILVPDEDLVGGAEEHHLEVSPRALVRVVNDAVRRDLGLIEVHNHGPEFPAEFSRWDHAGFREVVPYMRSSLPGGVYGALVLGGPENADGLVWHADDARPFPIADIEVLGDKRLLLPTTHTTNSGSRDDHLGDSELELFDRQVRAWGALGQRELGRLRVAIAGLGGLGTIVLEQLAQSGVRNFVLVDFDVVECTNLTRTALFRLPDVGRLKVEAARDRVLDLSPDSNIVAVPESLYSERALEELARADIIVGCTDDSATRFALNELSLRSLRPYLDMGSQIHTLDGVLGDYGGRFTFAMPGAGCLICARAIDPCEASWELRPHAAREADVRAGYIEGAREHAPAVRSLNGSVASLGVFELQAWATGLRRMEPQTLVDGARGQAHRLKFRSKQNCLACAEFLGQGVGEEFFTRYAAVARQG